MAKGSDNDFPSILVTEQGSKPTAPASSKQRIYMKTDHKLYHEDNGGTETEVGGGLSNPMDTAGDIIVGGTSGAPAKLAKGSDSTVLTMSASTHLPVWQAPAAAKGVTYTDRKDYMAGSITMNSTSFASVQAALNLTLTAVAGDVVMVGFSAQFSNENVDVYFDACSLVSGSPVNYLSNGSGTPPTSGYGAWYLPPAHYYGMGGPILYTLQAGDISAGTVTIQVCYRTVSATNRTIYGGTNTPITSWAVNLSR